MSTNSAEQKLGLLDGSENQDVWRYDVLNRISVLFAVLGLPIWILMLFNWQTDFFLPATIYLLLCLATVIRVERYTNIRAHTLCLALIATGIWSVNQSGIEGTGGIIMAASCVFSTVLISVRGGAVYIALSVVALAWFGYRAVNSAASNTD